MKLNHFHYFQDNQDEESQNTDDMKDDYMEEIESLTGTSDEVTNKPSTKRPLLSSTGKAKKQYKRRILEEAENTVLSQAVKALEKATTSSAESSDKMATSMNPDDLFGQYIASELKSVSDPN